MLAKYTSQCLSSSHLIDGSYYYYFWHYCNMFRDGLHDTSLSSCTIPSPEPKPDNQLTYSNLSLCSGVTVILHTTHLQWLPIAYSRGRSMVYVKYHIVNILRLCGTYVLYCHYLSLPLYSKSIHKNLSWMYSNKTYKINHGEVQICPTAYSLSTLDLQN